MVWLSSGWTGGAGPLLGAAASRCSLGIFSQGALSGGRGRAELDSRWGWAEEKPGPAVPAWTSRAPREPEPHFLVGALKGAAPAVEQRPSLCPRPGSPPAVRPHPAARPGAGGRYR